MQTMQDTASKPRSRTKTYNPECWSAALERLRQHGHKGDATLFDGARLVGIYHACGEIKVRVTFPVRARSNRAAASTSTRRKRVAQAVAATIGQDVSKLHLIYEQEVPPPSRVIDDPSEIEARLASLLGSTPIRSRGSSGTIRVDFRRASCGRTPRPATNAGVRGSRRGSMAARVSSSGDDPPGESPRPPRIFAGRRPLFEQVSDGHLVRRARAGEPAAFDALIQRHEGLLSWPPFPPRPGLGESDLAQASRLGLWKAVETYRPDRAAEFKTYASKCIRNERISAVRRGSSCKQRALNRAIPLDAVAYVNSDGEQVTFEAALNPRSHNDPAAEIIAWDSFLGAWDTMSDREREAVAGELNGKPSPDRFALARARKKVIRALVPA